MLNAFKVKAEVLLNLGRVKLVFIAFPPAIATSHGAFHLHWIAGEKKSCAADTNGIISTTLYSVVLKIKERS